MIGMLLRPWRHNQLLRSLAYVSMDLPLGAMALGMLGVPSIVAVSTVLLFPLSFTIAVLVLFLAGAGAAVERSRIRSLLDAGLVDPRQIAPVDRWWKHVIAPFAHKPRWKEYFYLLLLLPRGIATTVLLGGAWGGSLALMALPAYVAILPDGSAKFGLFTLDVTTSWSATFVGLGVMVVVAPWLTVVIGGADLAMARWFLSQPVSNAMEQRVRQVESRRAAAVDSAEAERRRIERDLHDGAQQRLIAVAMDLGIARDRLAAAPPEQRELVDRAHDEVKAALKELRDLVRGIHPVILEDRGLDAALSAVVARSPVPVTLNIEIDSRPVPAVESAAYYIVCEALANIARHSEASHASVIVRNSGDVLMISVFDDGVGGANKAKGSGLVGLEERVDALGGHFQVVSPIGGPTELRVELPCG